MLRNLFVLIVLHYLAASAATITDFSQVPLNAALGSFGSFADPNNIRFTSIANALTVGPVNVSLSSNNLDESVASDQAYNLGNNGVWGAPLSYIGIDFDLFGGDAYSLTLTFSSPVSAVAGLVNYRIPSQEEIDLGIIYSSPLMESLDEFGSVIESLDIGLLAPINTLNTLNNGAFRGFLAGSESIYGLRLSNAGMVLTDLYLFNEDIAALVNSGDLPGKTESPNPPPPPPTGGEIPEPSSFALILAGLVFLAFRLK